MQRVAALRVARCYRTVSDMAALLLARMPPAFLQAASRKDSAAARRAGQRSTKQETTAAIVREWQTLWEATPKAEWTRRLIPDLPRWWYQGPRTVSFHMAQALTGHGCFQKYLWSRGRALSTACCHCPSDVDDVEHTLFICMFWNLERRDLVLSLGRHPRPEDVADLLCGPAVDELPTDMERRARIIQTADKLRELFVRMVEEFIGRKEDMERERQKEGRAI